MEADVDEVEQIGFLRNAYDENEDIGESAPMTKRQPDAAGYVTSRGAGYRHSAEVEYT